MLADGDVLALIEDMRLELEAGFVVDLIQLGVCQDPTLRRSKSIAFCGPAELQNRRRLQCRACCELGVGHDE